MNAYTCGRCGVIVLSGPIPADHVCSSPYYAANPLEAENANLRAEVEALAQKLEKELTEGNYLRMKVEALELHLKDANLQVAELKAVAYRCYLKFGANTDWTEWRDLAEALGVVPEKKEGV